MTDADVAAELVAIKNRLAALASDPHGPDVAMELGSIRGQLRQLAVANEELGQRLGELLGLRHAD